MEANSVRMQAETLRELLDACGPAPVAEKGEETRSSGLREDVVGVCVRKIHMGILPRCRAVAELP